MIPASSGSHHLGACIQHSAEYSKPKGFYINHPIKVVQSWNEVYYEYVIAAIRELYREQYTKERYSITYDFISCVNWDYEDLLKFFINNKDKLSVYCIYFYKKYLIVSVDQDQDYPKGEGVEECDIITERLPFWKGSTIRIFCYFYYLQNKDYKGLEALIRKCKIPQCRKFMKELIGLWNVCFDNEESAS